MDPTNKNKTTKKASYKDIHLPLGVVGVGVGSVPRGALFCPTLKRARSACARERGVCTKEQPPWALGWARSRDAVEAGRRTYSSRGAGWGLSIPSAPAAEPDEWWLRAPSAPCRPQTPRPIRPFPRSSAAPRARGRTPSPRSPRSRARSLQSSDTQTYCKPERRRERPARAAAKSPGLKTTDFSRKTLPQVGRKRWMDGTI